MLEFMHDKLKENTYNRVEKGNIDIVGLEVLTIEESFQM